jgi:hypothetical protein
MESRDCPGADLHCSDNGQGDPPHIDLGNLDENVKVEEYCTSSLRKRADDLVD